MCTETLVELRNRNIPRNGNTHLSVRIVNIEMDVQAE